MWIWEMLGASEIDKNYVRAKSLIKDLECKAEELYKDEVTK